MATEQCNSPPACPQCFILEDGLKQVVARLEQLEEKCSKLQEENRRLQEENDKLREENGRLQGELTKAQRSGKRQAAPFRRKKKKRNPKRPGRKKGHPGSNRSRPKEIDQTLSAPPLETCPNCGGGDLRDLKQEENFEADLPPVRPLVTRFEFQSAWCSQCRRRVCSRHDRQTSTARGAAASHLGPRVRALVAEFKGGLGVAYRKIATILQSQFHLEVSPGALAQSNVRLAEQAQATMEALKQELQNEPVVHADETGWRIGGSSAWMWVICSPRLTLYEITSHRCAHVVRDVLGEHFSGILMRDGWSSYDAQLKVRMLRCLLHLSRNGEDLETLQSGTIAGEAMSLFVLWIEGVFDLRRRADGLSQKAYEQEAQEMVEWLDEFSRQTHDSEKNQRFATRLQEIRHHIVPILEDPALPATNNLAEQQIRPAVIHRKVAAGNKTWSGAGALQVLSSLAASCRQQGYHLTQLVEDLLTSPRGHPVKFWNADPS